MAWWAAAGVAGMLVLGSLGCGTDSTAPAGLPAARAYWALELNQHAIMLALQAPYDTVQLTATPKTVLGTPLTTTGTVQYQVSDSMVTVSPTGLVTAHYVTGSQPVRVIASLQDPAQGITHTDTAFIVVTTVPAPRVASYSLQPVQGDSAKRSLDFVDSKAATVSFYAVSEFDWPVRAVNTAGTSVCSPQSCTLLVYYRSSRPLVALMDPHTGHVTQQDTGHVVFTAQTLAYGQVLRDSVAFQIGYKLQYTVMMTLMLVMGVLTLGFVARKKVILGVGALVTFCNAANKLNNQPVDIVFDHPAAVDSASCTNPSAQANGYPSLPPTGSGNIAPFGGDTTSLLPNDVACRRFNTPGVYHYHSTLFPSDTYEIDVQQDP